MTSQNHDTDPSTPGAKRVSDPRTAAAEPVGLEDELPPSGRRVSRFNTDPGIAPPPPKTLSVPPRPLPGRGGVVVPPVTAKPNDSIDILLEGMSQTPPDRVRTTPQTDGQAAATYHAEHTVRAARTSPDDEPKVVVERLPMTETVRLDREVVDRAIASLDHASARPERGWAETTAVSVAPPITGRVTIAVLAGFGVVAMIFIALQWTARQPASGPASTVPVAVAPVAALAPRPPAVLAPAPLAAAPPVPAAASESAVAPPASGEAERLADAPSPGSGSARRATPSLQQPKPARPHLRPQASPTRAKAADVGEFKTSF